MRISPLRSECQSTTFTVGVLVHPLDGHDVRTENAECLTPEGSARWPWTTLLAGTESPGLRCDAVREVGRLILNMVGGD